VLSVCIAPLRACSGSTSRGRGGHGLRIGAKPPPEGSLFSPPPLRHRVTVADDTKQAGEVGAFPPWQISPPFGVCPAFLIEDPETPVSVNKVGDFFEAPPPFFLLLLPF